MKLRSLYRFLSLILITALLFTCLPAVRAAEDSGTCGTRLTWRFDAKTGLLTITGSGKMTNWSRPSEVPWYYRSGEIREVSVGSGVTGIGANAFARCAAMTGITLPSTLTSIGDQAFSGCAGLSSISLPAAVGSIGEGVFAGCTTLKKINVNASNTTFCSDSRGVLFDKAKTLLIRCPCGYSGSYSVPATVEEIGFAAFSGCSGLTSVTIPDSVELIGAYAFAVCRRLSSVTIPEGVRLIGANAFADCSGLSSVQLPGSASSILTGAFSGCTALIRLSVPKGVTRLGERAFCGCTALESLSLAEGLTEVGSSAFASCPALTSVTVPASVSVIGETAFGFCFDESAGSPSRVPGFTVYGTKGSAAQTYAAANGFPFAAPAAPVITVQPKDQAAELGGTVTFHVAATGGSLRYQWQYKKAGETDWHTWSGKISAALPVTASKTNGGCQYRCVVTNSLGSATSSTAVLTVLSEPAITTQPKSQTCVLGETVTFHVAATGGNLRYQWQYKKAGETNWHTWSGKTSAALPVTASKTNGGCQYRCVVSNSLGSATSSTAVLTVLSEPAITTQPKSQACVLGETVTFHVAATGGNLRYQWQYKKAGETNWHTWSGKTSAALPVTASKTNGGCQYRCMVSNAAGSVISSAATLTVR